MNDSDSDGYDNRDGSKEMDNLPASHPAMIAARARMGGWQGGDMELQHSLETDKASSAAVDLSQFRNTEVGKGYQAKHVVRQKTGEGNEAASDDTVVVKAMKETKNCKAEKKAAKPTAAANIITLEDMLANKGLRDFGKEIESILANP